MGATVFYVLMVQEYMFKAKVSEIKNIPCVQEIFKDFGAINMKKKPKKKQNQDLMDMFMNFLLIMILILVKSIFINIR